MKKKIKKILFNNLFFCGLKIALLLYETPLCLKGFLLQGCNLAYVLVSPSRKVYSYD